MTMTSDAKKALSSTIRAVRTRLLDDLRASAESTYRLSLPASTADLPEAERLRRARLEDWISEQLRAEATRTHKTVEQLRAKGVHHRLLTDVLLEAGATWLNRLVLLRLLEASPGLRKDPVLTGGWESRGYKAFRTLAPALVHDDPTEGYAWLLGLVFADLATELPGLYGDRGLHALLPMPTATLRHLVETLDDDTLASCWTDDMTLGWVYQYWNDPAREALDVKIKDGGKIEPHEIASKTQMFTERYMVDWLLQNSLGPMWLAMCRKHGWTPEAESSGTLDRLEDRRVDWRAKREAGDVSLTELMPLHGELEQHWAYFLPQPIPDDAVEHAADSVRDLKILDPAVGSGHFLVVAFDLLFALYQEEARHRGEVPASDDDADSLWTAAAIVQRIVGYNLAGIDLDPRAVQIAAAGLWLKAQQRVSGVQLTQMNLVASRLSLASLPPDDPALVELRRQVEEETGIPGQVTDTIVNALKGADHLGSLLKVDDAVEQALEASNVQFLDEVPTERQLILGDVAVRSRKEARENLERRLGAFLARRTSGADLGLRLRGEQLAAGVRFLRLVKEGQYNLVTGNPPYQGMSRLADTSYIRAHYRRARSDLFACFMERALSLCGPAGASALLTMRNWMFIQQYKHFREHIVRNFDVRALGDFSIGAFSDVPNDLLSVVASVIRRAPIADKCAVGQMPTPADERAYDRQRTARKIAATLTGIGGTKFQQRRFLRIEGAPILHWWGDDELDIFDTAPLGHTCPARNGLCTTDNTRFVRYWWEPALPDIHIKRYVSPVERASPKCETWVPVIKGADGRKWFEDLRDTVLWDNAGLEIGSLVEWKDGNTSRKISNTHLYFQQGVAFATVGDIFVARVHRFASIFDVVGASVFPSTMEDTVCMMNSSLAVSVLNGLNPTVHYTSWDVNRLPAVSVKGSRRTFEQLEAAFSGHESHREPSVEYLHPGPSPWRHAQEWAQLAVDRPEGDPLPDYVEQLDPEPPTDHVSYALGVALGRFHSDGTGLIDPTTADISHALPAGTCFLDGTLDPLDTRDSLGHHAAAGLHTTWSTHGPDIADTDLRSWLRLSFFKDIHRQMYDNRPIHFPLSSRKKTFVAWVTIHRWTADTLRLLLADHLHPALSRLEGELTDLRTARDGADAKQARSAEKRFGKVMKWHEELADFIRLTEDCAERGAPPTDPSPKKCPPREIDARYIPDLDDGVMINSAGLWPLLDSQWKDPKKWWKELCTSKGRKDYDWSHLAMRYFPDRVDGKCKEDPSLGVAHGCFWRYHPERAWAWELRLQDEIGPDFRIAEVPYEPGGRDVADPGDAEHRRVYLQTHPEEAVATVEKELRRRVKKAEEPVTSMGLLESGLWTAVPEACWGVEVRAAAKQGVGFVLEAPDAAEARQAFLKQRTKEAVEIVQTEAERLRKKTKGKLGSMQLPCAGVWSVAPSECLRVQRELSARQKSLFRLLAPDAPEEAADGGQPLLGDGS